MTAMRHLSAVGPLQEAFACLYMNLYVCQAARYACWLLGWRQCC